MRKMQLLFVMVGLFLFMGAPVSATSWAELDPKDVVERADVIVRGTYDLSSEPKQSDFIFQGLKFNVAKVYRGDDIKKQIVAGLDPFDDSWVDDFQKNGGEFVLFLEDREETEFLVPVGGPNGMVQLKNDKIVGVSDAKKSFFEEFLKKQTEKPVPTDSISKKAKESKPAEEDSHVAVIYSGIGVGAAALAGAMFVLKRRR